MGEFYRTESFKSATAEHPTTAVADGDETSGEKTSMARGKNGQRVETATIRSRALSQLTSKPSWMSKTLKSVQDLYRRGIHVVYCDSQLLVINKPNGLVSQSTNSLDQEKLASASPFVQVDCS